MTPASPPPLLFPIRELVQRTGVNASTLRAWENRHELLKPVRTPSGHRLYGDEDVQRVRRLQELLAQGLSLSEIGPLLDAADSMGSRTQGEAEPRLVVSSAWQGYLAESLRALEDFSSERLDALYNEACALYPIDLITHNLLVPVLEQLGRRWEQRVTGIAEEHFFSAWLRNKLGARLHHSVALPRGKPVILACLPGEHHEIGLLLCALGLLGHGQRVIYLGADMPTRQIVHVSRHAHAVGIVLAGRACPDPEPVVADIAWLVAHGGTPVYVGSHFAAQAEQALEAVGAIPLGDNLRVGLRHLQALGSASAANGRAR